MLFVEGNSWLCNLTGYLAELQHNSSKSKYWMEIFKKTWPSGKLASSFVSETIRISIEP